MSGQLKIQMPMGGANEAYGMSSKNIKTELVSNLRETTD